MREKAIKYLNSLISDNTSKSEIDIIKYIKECIKKCEYVENDKNKVAEQAIEYLNEKAGTKFKNVDSNLKFIRARLTNYTLEDIKSVIDKKVEEWKGTKMQMYIRPETLFNATKFESYANGLCSKKETNKTAIIGHNYTDNEINGLFDNIEEIEL